MEATSEMNKPLCFRSTGLSSLGSARSVEAYLSSSHPPHGLLAHRSGRAIASGIAWAIVSGLQHQEDVQHGTRQWPWPWGMLCCCPNGGLDNHSTTGQSVSQLLTH